MSNFAGRQQPPIAAELPGSPSPLRRLLTLLPEAAFLSANDRITFVNQAARRLFGADPGSLVGRAPIDLLHPDARGGTADRTGPLPGPAPADTVTEATILRPDGTTRSVETTAVRLGDEHENAVLTVMHDVSDLKRAQAELGRSRDDLRRLAIGLDSVQENERQRIACELHDELQQTLAAIHLELGAIGTRVVAPPIDAAARLERVDALALAALGTTRRIVNDLRPPILEDLGLEAALEAMVTQFAQRTGVSASFRAPPDPAIDLQIRPMVSTCLYRTAQEALSNVARHAKASEVALSLSRGAEGGILLRVSDNGDGMDVDDRRRPFTVGLLAMRERLRAVGGSLNLVSERGTGTTVEALVAGMPVPVAPAPVVTRPSELLDPQDLLLRFLHHAPIGLAQATLDGQIETMNPVAAQLLLPFSSDGRLDNLFAVLMDAAPHLRRLVADVAQPTGVVCEGLPIEIASGGERRLASVVALGILKQEGSRLVVVLQQETGSPG